MTSYEQITEATEQLSQAFDAIVGDPDKFRAYLAMLGRMHRYSPNNIALIYWQCEHASAVGSYKHWQTEGRQVRKGEKAIRIFAPVPVTVKDAAGTIQTDEDGNAKTRTGFRLVPVFDISQTDGPELPQIPEPTKPDQPLTIDQHAAFARLRDVIAAEGFAYTYDRSLTEYQSGYCDYAGKRIGINPHLPEAAQLKTTIHELAHLLAAHRDHEEGKASREAIAEGCAFVVCAALGLDTSGYSAAYIAGYADDPDRLRESMNRIKALSADILDRIAEKGGSLDRKAA
jgi:hypothetical protein